MSPKSNKNAKEKKTMPLPENLKTEQDFEARYLAQHIGKMGCLENALKDLSDDVVTLIDFKNYNTFDHSSGDLDFSKLNEEFKENQILSNYMKELDPKYVDEPYFSDKESFDTFMNRLCDFLLNKIWEQLQGTYPEEFIGKHTKIEFRNTNQATYLREFRTITDKLDRTSRDSAEFKEVMRQFDVLQYSEEISSQNVKNLEKCLKDYLRHCNEHPRKFSSRRSSRIKNVQRLQKICTAYRNGVLPRVYLTAQIANKINDAYANSQNSFIRESTGNIIGAKDIVNTNAFKQMIKENQTIDLFHKTENPKKTLTEFLKLYDRLDRQNGVPALNYMVDVLEGKQKSNQKSSQKNNQKSKVKSK